MNSRIKPTERPYKPRLPDSMGNAIKRRFQPTTMRLVQFIFLLLIVVDGCFSRAYGQGSVSSVTILTFSGNAEVSRRENVWDPAHTNQVLLVGDRMRTGPNSRATIRLS